MKRRAPLAGSSFTVQPWLSICDLVAAWSSWVRYMGPQLLGSWGDAATGGLSWVLMILIS